MAGTKVPILINCGKTMVSRSLASILLNSQSTLLTRFRGFSTASAELGKKLKTQFLRRTRLGFEVMSYRRAPQN